MFKKFSRNIDVLKKLENGEVQKVLADETIVNNLTKLAKDIKRISPKSDEFLYFSIVFLKAAESATLGNDGLPKKLGSGEQAWGYFDDSWKWHGNVPPHKNNNSDIFPESELKKAASKWIGLPLCKDHQSSSVDGIRGIILDTYYDEKFKQVVGLCALDKVNYPELARKVETGVVRYGSMGTAVERSICSECGNIAKTANEYCVHVNNRTAHGEINVGLNPIEYSLVVQPAEPQAILLKCIASLQDYKSEFKSRGIQDVDSMLGKLSLGQAQHLEKIMKTACGEQGCSIEKRDNIIKSFFNNNKSLISEGSLDDSSIDTASEFSQEIRNLYTASASAEKQGDPASAEKIKDIASNLVDSKVSEQYKPDQTSEEEFDYSRPAMQESIANPGPELELGTTEEEVSPKLNYPNSDTLVSVGSNKNSTIRSSIKNILEEYMNESRLKKRAELRRKIAYMQGGSEGAEPKDFESIKEDASAHFDKDKQMKQTGSTGGQDGLFPGDAEKKQKLSRAELQERAMRRVAYMQGGSEGREPNTYKNEYATEKSLRENEDRQMKQTGTMGGDSGMFPGDSQLKEMLKRAKKYRGLTKSAKYVGPSLSTKMKYVRDSNDNIIKSASKFEIYAGDEKVISVTASDIFGKDVSENWDWMRSQEYGQRICKYVRAHGMENAIYLLKNAQEAPAPEMAELPEEAPEMPELPAAGEEAAMPEMPEMEAAGEEEADEDPVSKANENLDLIESKLDEIRDLVATIESKKGSGVDINVNIDKEEVEGVDELDALASEVLGQLKKVASEIDESADEIAMVSETYENISKISARDRVRFKKLAAEAINESTELIGEANATIRLAKSIVPSLEKRAAYHADDYKMSNMDDDQAYDASMGHANDLESLMSDMDDMISNMEDDATDHQEDDAADLVAEAMVLRRERREELLKQAELRILNAQIEKEASEETTSTEEPSTRIKAKIQESIVSKQANEERQNYKIKLRRAYDVALDMQKKGLIARTKTALDRQVDEIIQFDDRAFESFKRSIANMKTVSNVKVASDLGGVNVGINEETATKKTGSLTTDILSSMWDK